MRLNGMPLVWQSIRPAFDPSVLLSQMFNNDMLNQA